MKFQDPSFKFFLNGRTDKPKAICSPLFQSWGHKKRKTITRKNVKKKSRKTVNQLNMFLKLLSIF